MSMSKQGTAINEASFQLESALEELAEKLKDGKKKGFTLNIRDKEGRTHQVCAGIGHQREAVGASVEAADRLLEEQPSVNGSFFYVDIVGDVSLNDADRIKNLLEVWYGRETEIYRQLRCDKNRRNCTVIIFSCCIQHSIDMPQCKMEEHFGEYHIRKLCRKILGKTLEIPQGIHVIGKEAFQKDIRTVDVPGLMENVETIVIPRSVYRIDSNAFRGQESVRKVIFGHGTRDKLMLAPGVFSGCLQLEELVNAPRYLELFQVSEEKPRMGLYRTFGDTALKKFDVWPAMRFDGSWQGVLPEETEIIYHGD